MRNKAVNLLLSVTLAINTGVYFVAPVAAQEATPSATVAPTSSPVVTESPAPETVTPAASPSAVPIEPAAPVTAPASSPLVLPPDPILNDAVSQPSGSSANLQQPVKLHALSGTTLQPSESISVELSNAKDINLKTQLTREGEGEVPFLINERTVGDKVLLIVDPPVNFKPGLYKLKVTDTTGHSEEQTFSWGQLSLNLDKNIYFANDKAYIGMTVLGGQGEALCNADVSLRIVHDAAGINDELSTGAKTIAVDKDCEKASLKPQTYFSTGYRFGPPGDYRLTLTVQDNGSARTVQQTVTVKETAPFQIKKTLSSRIFPWTKYTAVYEVTANEDFDGTVTQTVPEGFVLTSADEALGYDSVKKMTSEEGNSAGYISMGRPLNGDYSLTQAFGVEETDPGMAAKYRQFGLLGHDGIDYAVPSGTPIVAVDDGTVALAEYADYGLTVVVQHGWGKSYYGHLSKIESTVGQQVKKGDEIGLSGSTGLSTGPHLHFGMKLTKNNPNNGYYGKIDPAPYFGNSVAVADTMVQQIAWNVKLKKGETAKLGYGYSVGESGQLYHLSGFRFTAKDTSRAMEADDNAWQLMTEPSQSGAVLGAGTGLPAGSSGSVADNLGAMPDPTVTDYNYDGSSAYRYASRLRDNTEIDIFSKQDNRRSVKLGNSDAGYSFEFGLVEQPGDFTANIDTDTAKIRTVSKNEDMPRGSKKDMKFNRFDGIKSYKNTVASSLKNGYLSWTVENNRLKEDIILFSRPDSNTLSFWYSLTNLTLQTGENSHYSLVNKAGTPVYSFMPPMVYDANGKEGDITMRIDEANGKITLEVDQAFLDKAAYPINIDPSMVYQGGLSTATAYANGKKIVGDANGNLYAVYVDSANDTQISYLNKGTSGWNKYGTAIDTATTEVSVATDSAGVLHLAVQSTTNTLVYYKVTPSLTSGVINQTGWTISTPLTIYSTNTSEHPSIIVDTMNNRPAIAFGNRKSSGGSQYGHIYFTRCKAGGACTATTDWIGAASANTTTGPVIDTVTTTSVVTEHTVALVQMPFVAGATYANALWVWYSELSTLDFKYKNATWANSTNNWAAWANETTKDANIAAASNHDFTAIRDEVNKRIAVTYRLTTPAAAVFYVDTAGTQTSINPASTVNYQDPTLAVDGSGNYYLIGDDTTGLSIKYVKYSGSWGSEVTLDPGFSNGDSVNRYPATEGTNVGSSIVVIYTKAGLSPARIGYMTISTPGTPVSPLQYDTDHATLLSTGATTVNGVSSNLYLDTYQSSTFLGETFTPKVEVKDTSTAFTGTATVTGKSMNYEQLPPPDRRSTDMIYDSANKRIVMFGGSCGDTTKADCNDTWVMTLKKGERSQWKKLTPGGTAPSAQRTHQLIYDSGNQRMILFGGDINNNVYALTLTAGSESWSQLTVSGTPPTFYVQHTMIYDAANARAIVFGGRSGTTLGNTVYQLTLPVGGGTPTWSAPATSGGPPTVREMQSAVYDPVNQAMWIFGGCTNGTTTTCTVKNELWKLTLPAAGTLVWSQASPTGSCPAAREAAMSVYDPDNQQMVIWAGWASAYVADVYSITLPTAGQPVCYNHTPTDSGNLPQPRAYGATKGVYDPDNKRAIFAFGYDGTYYDNESVVFDDLSNTGTWAIKALNMTNYMIGRDAPIMVFDSTNNNVVLWGGSSQNPAYAYHTNDAWKMNISGTPVWQDMGSDSTPIQRELESAVYDPNSKNYISCFGLNVNEVMNDCWSMSLPASGRSTWTNITPSGTGPTYRWGAPAVYDSGNKTMVVFGGKTQNLSSLNDIAVLDLSKPGTYTWLSNTTSGTPPPVRWGAIGIYDPVRSRAIFFGGTNDTTYYNTVYELTLPIGGTPTWRQMSPTGTLPATRRTPVAVYDPDRGDGTPRMVIFGGYDGTNEYNDVWELSIPGAGDGAWTQLSPTGALPYVRRTSSAAYDSVNDRMIVFGGRSGSAAFFDDTWALKLNSTPAWTRLDPEVQIHLSVPVSGLTNATSYHWQAWATGDLGDSAAVTYGGNSDTPPAGIDFQIQMPTGPTLDQLLKHGAYFNSSGVRKPFTF